MQFLSKNFHFDLNSIFGQKLESYPSVYKLLNYLSESNLEKSFRKLAPLAFFCFSIIHNELQKVVQWWCFLELSKCHPTTAPIFQCNMTDIQKKGNMRSCCKSRKKEMQYSVKIVLWTSGSIWLWIDFHFPAATALAKEALKKAAKLFRRFFMLIQHRSTDLFYQLIRNTATIQGVQPSVSINTVARLLSRESPLSRNLCNK